MMTSKFSDRKDFEEWSEMWIADKKAVLDTMVRNMKADLDAGYDFFGKTIQRQMKEINDYKEQMETEMDMFGQMEDEKKVARWCFWDMKKRGVIE